MTTPPNERQKLLADLSTVAIRDLVELWRRAANANVDFAEFLVDAFPELATSYADIAADLAADWYEQSAPDLDFVAIPVGAPRIQALKKSAQWALGADGKQALNRLSGTLQRTVFNGARETTILNTEFEPGARWARHASANACAFCAMLASRGAVYRTEADALTVRGRSETLSVGDRRAIAAGQATRDELLARRVNQKTYVLGKRKGQTKVRQPRGVRALGDKYHDNCHCVAVEVRPGKSYHPPDYVERWDEAYIRASRESRTKGQFGAIDIKAVLSKMREDLNSH